LESAVNTPLLAAGCFIFPAPHNRWMDHLVDCKLI
jgi:hypothetical protein